MPHRLPDGTVVIDKGTCSMADRLAPDVTAGGERRESRTDCAPLTAMSFTPRPGFRSALLLFT